MLVLARPTLPPIRRLRLSSMFGTRLAQWDLHRAERHVPGGSMSAAQVHVRHMLDRIEHSYSEPITLRTLSAELQRQSAYLGAMFRQEVGVPMRQWLTAVRLDHASALIREGIKVEAVSLLVGYRSKKNFYRQFKRRFGTTPIGHRVAD